ncbi:MAG: DnaD domain protein [Muribaculaceae bacterium]|nr:DnaD domain protein [Roseburia sp.]MCM1430810.1 DnaD domain protein [Muribaculaceae bacterium]MCM1492789.1 DnaD domain protein [Muribaculaceae bacterium]
MVELQLHSDCPSTDTIVPNKFIDTYMPEANGEFVKVYLYLLHSLQSHAYNCTVSAIADHFNQTEKDVVRALNYWQKQGLLALELNSEGNISICMMDLGRADTPAVLPQTESKAPLLRISAASDPAPAPASVPAAAASVSVTAPASVPAAAAGVSVTAPASVPAAVAGVSVTTPASVPTATAGTPAPETARTPAKRTYTADELTEFRNNPDISELFFVVETYIRHPLTANDMNTVLFWHEELHFSTELIVYLLEYCISKGHTSMRYLDKVAQNWHAENITTVEQAKEDAAIHSQAYYGVMKALGITGRSLVKAETAYIKKWTNEYGFDLPLIQEACGRTMTATHQPSFEYTDSILTRWHENQVHTLADIEALDKSYSKTRKVTVKTIETPARKNAFNNFSQRTYDYDKLEELLLTTPLRG